jgi:hypothetical protein
VENAGTEDQSHRNIFFMLDSVEGGPAVAQQNDDFQTCMTFGCGVAVVEPWVPVGSSPVNPESKLASRSELW